MDRVAARVTAVEAALDAALASGSRTLVRITPNTPLSADSTLTGAHAVAAFEDMVTSRTLDVVARELKAQGSGYYTISSAGHEDNVVVGARTRPTDPAFLHYRSGAFVLARARRAGAVEVVADLLHSLMASRDDPIARGRHKVWGSRPMWIVPQTSTIASHLPKAVGAAIAVDRRRTLGVWPDASHDVPEDAIVVTSFGDASLNHASALAGINAARWARRRGTGVPVLFVCEDNGIGISVPTPPRWVESSVSGLAGLHYVPASGELHNVWAAVEHAVTTARDRRAPVFLHLATTRLWGHAGSDVEAAYRDRAAIAAAEARDPVLRTARQLLATGAADAATLRRRVDEIRADVRARASGLAGVGHLASVDEIIAPLAPHRPERIRAEVADRYLGASSGEVGLDPAPRAGRDRAGAAQDRTLAAAIRGALHDELMRRPELLVFGEDVGRKGGVYGVSSGLQARFGRPRVFDTLLDETSILGLAQGLGLLGLLPVAEIQYLAYLHNALDQLRGEACSTAFFSDGAFTNPMVVRVAGLAYQKGFGGHFHNDNAIGALRDIPGLAIVVPARPEDAPALLRAATAMAAVDGRVVVFLEPIALYHERDLYEPGDDGWLRPAVDPAHASGSGLAPGPAGVLARGSGGDTVLLPGEIGVHGQDRGAGWDDVCIVTYGNGLRMSLRSARRLAEDGISARVLDLRWLAPLPLDAVREHAEACGAVLVADECRATGGGIADAVIAGLVEGGFRGQVASVRSADSYVPLGPAADAVLLSEDEITRAAAHLVHTSAGRWDGG